MKATRQPEYEPRDSDLLALVATAIGCLLAFGLTAWCAGATSTFLTSARAPHVPVSRGPALLIGLIRNLGAPWRAWPEGDRRLMPGDLVLWWLAALPGVILPLGVLAGLALLAREALRDGDATCDPRRARPPIALLSFKPRPGRFPLGRHLGAHVSSSAESHLLVIGPTGSGKTSACLIPALLTHSGSAVVVSTKPDIKRHTLAARERLGEVLAWDPLGEAGEAWDMLAGCGTWRGACERSEALVHAARLDIESSVGQFWDSHTDRALAPYVLAAAVGKQPPSAIYAWVASQRVDEPQRILANAVLPVGDRDAALLDLRTASILSPEDRSSLAISLIRILAPLRIPGLARNLSDGFTPERLLDRSRPATLYVTVPADEQRRARAFVVALVEATYLAAYRSGSEISFDPPLLLLIDEAAHTAPLRDLPQMTQVARDAGIRIATSWQDASQIHHRYGREQAGTLISASQTRVILPGCSDTATRELVRNSIGEPARQRRGARARVPIDPRRLDSKMLVSHHYDHAFLLRPAPWFRSRRLRRVATAEEKTA
jgi:type IV secretion system protein VirD4